MVRRGSTVRVRQRALQKRRTSALLRSGRLARRRTCGGYGADYGAFASRTLSAKVDRDLRSRRRSVPAAERGQPGGAFAVMSGRKTLVEIKRCDAVRHLHAEPPGPCRHVRTEPLRELSRCRA